MIMSASFSWLECIKHSCIHPEFKLAYGERKRCTFISTQDTSLGSPASAGQHQHWSLYIVTVMKMTWIRYMYNVYLSLTVCWPFVIGCLLIWCSVWLQINRRFSIVRDELTLICCYVTSGKLVSCNERHREEERLDILLLQ